MTVKEIIKEYLKANGYGGLCGFDCGCEADDLAPCCEGDISQCEPGYKIPCPDDCEFGGDCEWHIVSEKPDAPKA